MKIGIIGAGQIGGALTRRLTALGHQVSVANSRGPETLADLAAETGAKPVSVAEAARNGEVVIVTIFRPARQNAASAIQRRREHGIEHGFRERQELVEVIARLQGRGAARDN